MSASLVPHHFDGGFRDHRYVPPHSPHTADTVSKAESVGLRVPAGATTAQVRFRYTGGNNWFWAVDGVRITSG
ncbi:hypothetical protein [Streptomyces sp. NPDC005780]|uniref:hypothetical protein n=1 Tax=Streptomyces sp. NPDC005780 TaxID=3364730 RepID=UPI0036BF28EF